MSHAILAPSAATRWINCPGSVSLISRLDAEGLLPERTTSVYADEGTRAHEVAAAWLEGWEPEHSPDDEEMATAVQRYVDLVRELADGADYVAVEAPINADDYVPGVWGTLDALIVDGPELIVCDLKYGKGVEVSAEENPQLMLYALGALTAVDLIYSVHRIRLVIHQPRIHSEPREWSCNVEYLLQFARQAAEAAQQAYRSDAPLNPGEQQCRWCDAKAHCPALRDQTAQTVYGELFDNAGDARGVDTLDETQLAEALQRLDRIESWCKAIRDRAVSELYAGRNIPGYKLVAGRRGQRRWSDEREVERMLREQFRLKKEDVYSMKLISPAQAEKLKFGPRRWERLASLIDQPEGKPAVVPQSDKRPALQTTATADEFSQEQ